MPLSFHFRPTISVLLFVGNNDDHVSISRCSLPEPGNYCQDLKAWCSGCVLESRLNREG